MFFIKEAIPVYISLVFIAQFVFSRQFKTYYRWIFPGAVVLIGGLIGYASYAQYVSWIANPLTRFFLPPYQSWGYFLRYCFWEFASHYALSIVIALIFMAVARWINKKYNDRFWYPEEIMLGSTSLFIVGHPGWLINLVALMLIMLIGMVTSQLIQKTESRFSFYYLWLPTALLTILISNQLEMFSLFQLLLFNRQ